MGDPGRPGVQRGPGRRSLGVSQEVKSRDAQVMAATITLERPSAWHQARACLSGEDWQRGGVGRNLLQKERLKNRSRERLGRPSVLFGVRSPVPAWRGVCGPRCWAWGQRVSHMDTPEVPGGATPSGAWEVISGQRTCCFIPQTPKPADLLGRGTGGAGLHRSLPAAPGAQR